jgi:hypothetical protein
MGSSVKIESFTIVPLSANAAVIPSKDFLTSPTETMKECVQKTVFSFLAVLFLL